MLEVTKNHSQFQYRWPVTLQFIKVRITNSIVKTNKNLFACAVCTWPSNMSCIFVFYYILNAEGHISCSRARCSSYPQNRAKPININVKQDICLTFPLIDTWHKHTNRSCIMVLPAWPSLMSLSASGWKIHLQAWDSLKRTTHIYITYILSLSVWLPRYKPLSEWRDEITARCVFNKNKFLQTFHFKIVLDLNYRIYHSHSWNHHKMAQQVKANNPHQNNNVKKLPAPAEKQRRK